MSYIASNMNRSRAKIDKENENKDIRKKLKNVQPKVQSNLLYSPTYTERTGNLTDKHAVKASSTSRGNNNNSAVNTERRSSPIVASNRTPISSPLHKSVGDDTSSLNKNGNIFPINRPLSMYMSSSFSQKARLNNRTKKSKCKASILPAISDTEPLIELDNLSASSKEMEELFTPLNGGSSSSSISDLRSSQPPSPRKPLPKTMQEKTPRKSARSNDKKVEENLTHLPSPQLDLISLSSGSTTYLNLDLDLCSLPSPSGHDDVFHMANLIPAPSSTQLKNTNSKLDTSATLIRKFRNVLQSEEHTMPEADINVVKNVLKTDERVNLLKTQEANPKLFKDILKTQLEEIVKSEKVVKNALRLLGASSKEVDTSTHRPIEVINVTQLQQHVSNNQKCYHKSCRKLKSRHSPDTSPRSHSTFEINRDSSAKNSNRKHKHNTADTFSIQDFTPHHEIVDAYTVEKGRRKTKYTKLMAAHTDPQVEFEEFIKGTLPLKRKTINSKTTDIQQIGYVHHTTQDDLQVNIVRGAFKERAEILKTKEAARPQVDVTFKNVPSLEKEILILKALGERLEATLKRSLSEPNLSDRVEGIEKVEKIELPSCSSNTSLTKELKRIDSTIEVFPGRRDDLKPLCYSMNIEPWENCAHSTVSPKGLRFEIGIVNEFLIVPKTIDELLNDSNSDFFIPKGDEPGALEQTSFQKLAEEPQTLMRYLKPKNASTPFNLIDQDPVFFNSFLLPNLKTRISEKRLSNSGLISEVPSIELPKICEGGDSLLATTEDKNILKDEPSCSKHSVKKLLSIKPVPVLQKKSSKALKSSNIELPVSATPSLRTVVRRGRIRRHVTPMPSDAFNDPKNNLLKTVLVGVVQISIFLLMIMAITYPDIKC